MSASCSCSRHPDRAGSGTSSVHILLAHLVSSGPAAANNMYVFFSWLGLLPKAFIHARAGALPRALQGAGRCNMGPPPPPIAGYISHVLLSVCYVLAVLARRARRCRDPLTLQSNLHPIRPLRKTTTSGSRLLAKTTRRNRNMKKRTNSTGPVWALGGNPFLKAARAPSCASCAVLAKVLTPCCFPKRHLACVCEYLAPLIRCQDSRLRFHDRPRECAFSGLP